MLFQYKHTNEAKNVNKDWPIWNPSKFYKYIKNSKKQHFEKDVNKKNC